MSQGKKLVTGLGPADFLVYDEDKPQFISRFGREKDPLAVLLLLDVSGSMKKYVRQMAKTANKALTLMTPDDKVSVMIFSKGTEVRYEFGNKYDEAAREIEVGVEEHDLPSGTSIYASILEAANEMRLRPERRAILILTDNMSLNYIVNEETVLRSLSSVDTTLNALVVGNATRPKEGKPKEGVYRNPDFIPTNIFKVAEESGGEALSFDRADEGFAALMERLRYRYTILYKAPEAEKGTFRRIRVELSPDARRKHPNATIRARSGYYTGE